jgi:hypothetical protein
VSALPWWFHLLTGVLIGVLLRLPRAVLTWCLPECGPFQQNETKPRKRKPAAKRGMKRR